MNEFEKATVLVFFTFCLGFGIVGLGVVFKRFGYRLDLAKLPVFGKFFLPSSRALSCATSSRDLVPLLTPYIQKGATVWVVGADLSYFDGINSSFWRSALRRWMDDGCSIKYLLVDQDGADSEALFQSFKLPKKLELVHPRSLGSDSRLDDLIHKYKTFHPTLLQNPDGSRAMWIEHFHPRGSAIAHDVEFVANRPAMSDARFERITNELEILTGCAIWPREKALAA
jgi:hypothetical protein